MTSAEVKNHQIQVNIPLPFHLDEHLNPSSPKRTLILLHGYGETKERMQRKLGQHLATKAQRIIVLNAPFPAPQLSVGGYKEGYAWYFRSQSLGLTMIAPEACEYFFEKLVNVCQLDLDQVSLIGFSQGGFILPYLAKKIKNLEQMIGISCGAHPHEFFTNSKPKFNIIHAIDDKLVEAKSAEEQFSVLGLDPKDSKLYQIDGGHEIDTSKVELVKKLLG